LKSRPGSDERRGFSGTRRSHALYQGTTLQAAEKVAARAGKQCLRSQSVCVKTGIHSGSLDRQGPGGPTAKRQPSPAGLGINPEDDLPAPACRGSAVGAALNLCPLAPVSLGVEEAGRIRKKKWGTPNTYGLDGKVKRNATSLEHLAVKDFVLFLTRRASCPDTTSHEQGRADGDEDCRAVRLKLEKPACEGV
jgi:hypothetical protein